MEFFETMEKTVNNGFLKGKTFFVGRGVCARVHVCVSSCMCVRARMHVCSQLGKCQEQEQRFLFRKRAKRNTGPNLNFVKHCVCDLATKA